MLSSGNELEQIKLNHKYSSEVSAKRVNCGEAVVLSSGERIQQKGTRTFPRDSGIDHPMTIISGLTSWTGSQYRNIYLYIQVYL